MGYVFLPTGSCILLTAIGHTSIPAGRVIAGQAALQATCANLLLFMSPSPPCDRSGLIPTNEGQFGLRRDTLWRWFEYTESAK